MMFVVWRSKCVTGTYARSYSFKLYPVARNTYRILSTTYGVHSTRYIASPCRKSLNTCPSNLPRSFDRGLFFVPAFERATSFVSQHPTPPPPTTSAVLVKQESPCVHRSLPFAATWVTPTRRCESIHFVVRRRRS